jgi:hypothetical protein
VAIVTALGTKLVPPWPTLTVVVAAEAIAGRRTTKRRDSRNFKAKCVGVKRPRLSGNPEPAIA